MRLARSRQTRPSGPGLMLALWVLNPLAGPPALAQDATDDPPPAATTATDDDPAGLLRSKRLGHEHGTTWVLDEEASVLRAAQDARSLAARTRNEEAQLRAQSGDPQADIQGLRQQVGMLDQQIAALNMEAQKLNGARVRAARSYRNMYNQQRSQLQQQQRQLNTMITELTRQAPQVEAQRKQLASDAVGQRASYEAAVDDLRAAVEKLVDGYAGLERDEAVVSALDRLSASTKVRQKLGPSRELLAVMRALGVPAGRTESIVLVHAEKGDHPGPGDRALVQLNHGRAVPMTVDPAPGGPVLLPAGITTRLGLKPTGQTIETTLDDGSKFSGPEMSIATVGVGRMTARDVTCLVVPDDRGPVTPRLGESFLKQFDFKYMPKLGRLVLTRAETEAETRARSRSKPETETPEPDRRAGPTRQPPPADQPPPR